MGLAHAQPAGLQVSGCWSSWRAAALVPVVIVGSFFFKMTSSTQLAALSLAELGLLCITKIRLQAEHLRRKAEGNSRQWGERLDWRTTKSELSVNAIENVKLVY